MFTPNDTILVELTEEYRVFLSIGDRDLIEYRWYIGLINDTPYIKIYMNKSLRFLHRVILERSIGRTLKTSELCDHINGDTLDNNRNNLRIASSAENNRNAKKGKNNKSGYKGVCWHNGANKWRAYIVVDYKQIHLGLFETAELAYEAYCEAAKKYHGEFARLE